jgi:eukaryotic-like serine/threonine-protein kinase
MSPFAAGVPVCLGRGRYAITGVLGHGGVGTVYRATDRDAAVEPGREVAIKVLSPELVGTNVERRFLREGEAMQALRHPNIVRVEDVGRDGDHAWMAMELMDRGTVQGLVKKRGPLPVSWVVHVADGLLAGLQRVHGAGLVHRDVKPGNVLIDRQGDVKLSDFGIVRDDESDLTQPGVTLGTSAYMSPEQMMDPTSVTARSDLFAVGATLYAIATARGPERLAWIEPGDNEPAFALVPAPLREILRKACAFSPSRRPADATEMRNALQALSIEFAGDAASPS